MLLTMTISVLVAILVVSIYFKVKVTRERKLAREKEIAKRGQVELETILLDELNKHFNSDGSRYRKDIHPPKTVIRHFFVNTIKNNAGNKELISMLNYFANLMLVISKPTQDFCSLNSSSPSIYAVRKAIDFNGESYYLQFMCSNSLRHFNSSKDYSLEEKVLSDLSVEVIQTLVELLQELLEKNKIPGYRNVGSEMKDKEQLSRVLSFLFQVEKITLVKSY